MSGPDNCSFCGKARAHVRALMAGNPQYVAFQGEQARNLTPAICNECVLDAAKLLIVQGEAEVNRISELNQQVTELTHENYRLSLQADAAKQTREELSAHVLGLVRNVLEQALGDKPNAAAAEEAPGETVPRPVEDRVHDPEQ